MSCVSCELLTGTPEGASIVLCVVASDEQCRFVVYSSPSCSLQEAARRSRQAQMSDEEIARRLQAQESAAGQDGDHGRDSGSSGHSGGEKKKDKCVVS